MRMTQFIGLSEKAREFLQNKCKLDTVQIFRNGVLQKEWTEPVREKWGTLFGMFEEEIPVFKYFLKDGSILKEVEQASPWSSGPVIFTCLEDEDGKRMYKWSKKKMEEFL